jgi:hypothetical protein
MAISRLHKLFIWPPLLDTMLKKNTLIYHKVAFVPIQHMMLIFRMLQNLAKIVEIVIERSNIGIKSSINLFTIIGTYNIHASLKR